MIRAGLIYLPDVAEIHGAIAQLGERYNGIVEVGSSILPGSTSSQIKSFLFLPGFPVRKSGPISLRCDQGSDTGLDVPLT